MTPAQPRPLREWLVAAIAGLVGIEILVGLLEAATYRPSLAGAYASEAALRGSSFGATLAAFHYWGSAALLLTTMALLVEMVCNEGYRDAARYFGALGCTIAAFILQVTGNLLPMDRHGVQTAVVESGIAGSAPGAGRHISGFMLAGPGFSAATVARWWAGHATIVPLCIVVATLLLWRPKTAPRSGYLVIPVLVLVLALFVRAPLGAAATPLDYDAFNAHVSWYTWPLHAMLSAFSRVSPSFAWIGSIGIPAALTIILVLLPWLGPKVTATAMRGATLLAAIAFLAIGAIFGGPVAALTGNRDPAAETAASRTRAKSTDPAILALVREGRQNFNAVGCSGCHGPDGAHGFGGPDLTKKFLQHDEPWFEQLIHNPRSVNPSATMPAFSQLSPNQVKSIATFLAEPK